MKKIGLALAFGTIFALVSCKSDLEKFESKINKKLQDGWYECSYVKTEYGEFTTITQKKIIGYFGWKSSEDDLYISVSNCKYEESEVKYDDMHVIKNVIKTIYYMQNEGIKEISSTNSKSFGSKSVGKVEIEVPYYFTWFTSNAYAKSIDLNEKVLTSNALYDYGSYSNYDTTKAYFDGDFQLEKILYTRCYDSNIDNKYTLLVDIHKIEKQDIKIDLSYDKAKDYGASYVISFK